MRQPREGIVFDRTANKVARAVFIKGNEAQATPETVARAFDFANWASALLMRHEGLCFSIYGENMVVPLLLQAFGISGLLDLLEQGAVRFWLERDVVMYLEPVRGARPLAPGSFNAGVHADPEESIAESFRRSTRTYEAKALRKLKRKLVDAHITVEHSFARHAVDFGHQGYELGRFRFAGLDPTVPLEDLDMPSRKALAALAQEMHDLSLIANQQMDTIDEFAIRTVCHESIERLRRGRHLENAFATIFRIEHVPELVDLFRTGVLSCKSLPALRAARQSEKFRRWIRSASSDCEADSIVSEYLAAISDDQSIWGRPAGRLLKTLSVSALSMGAGAALGGPLGAVTGAALGPAIVDVGMDLIDEFVLGGILSGWRPRNYFESVIRPKLEA